MSTFLSRCVIGFGVAMSLPVLLATGCGSSSSPTSPTTPTTPTVSSVGLTVSTTALFKKGATAQMTATATMSNGTTQDVTSTCTGWASDNALTATISSSGLVTAVGTGSATFTATCSGVFARLLSALTVATKATPTVALTTVSLGVSKDPPYLPMVYFKVWYSETGKAFGYSVNFMNFTVRNPSGSTIDAQSFGPDMFTNGATSAWKAGDPYLWPAWGSNRIDPSGSKYACFVSTSFASLPSSITLTWATQTTDDQNVVTSFGSTTSASTPGGQCSAAAMMPARSLGLVNPSHVDR